MTHGTTVVRSFALALLVAFCPLRTPAQSLTPPEATDNEQFVAYWTTETGWHSELQLRNNRTDGDLMVTPALRMAGTGAEIALAPVSIKPQEVTTVDLDTAIGASAPQLIGTYGSVVLRYHSIGDLNLYAAMMIHNIGHPIAFHIDGMGESQDMQAGSREGVWWLPKDTTSDYLILTNQGGDTIPLDLSLYDASGQKATQKLLLGPRETNRYSLRKLILAAGLTGSYGGIKVSASAHAGALDSQHFLFDETAGFSAVLKMFDHDPNTKLEQRDFAKTAVWTTRAPMLALSNPDPALAFPTGTTLRPQLFVRNTNAKPADASLRFNWRGSGATGKGPQISLHLNPFETRRVDVAALTFPPQANWTSVTLTSSARPDEIVAVAASYDDTLRYGAQTPFSDQLNFAWQGGRWEFDAQHNSIITAGNGGTKPTLAAFTIFYNQGTQRYDLEQTLQPDEQMWMDVGKLIREHVQDKNGKTLPDTLTSGSYEFRDLTDIGVGSLFEGKVIYDKTYGHVTYGCARCCAYSLPYFLFNPLGIPYLDGAQQLVKATSNCGGAGVDVTSAYGTWSTANTAIAKVDSRGYHTGMAVGSTTTTGAGYLVYSANRNCPQNIFTNQGGDTVVSAVVTQRTSNTVSNDDAAKPNYQNAEGTTSLGPVFPPGTYGGCALGYETIGSISPTIYSGLVILHRWRIAKALYVNSSGSGSYGGQDDTSSTSLRDDDPQSGGSAGKVYDLDAPVIAPVSVDGNTYRYRANFYAYAALPDGTQISPNYYFYVRQSCTKTSVGYRFVNDVSGDNQIGTGTTNLSWNLQ
jgi:hypothetical protein